MTEKEIYIDILNIVDEMIKKIEKDSKQKKKVHFNTKVKFKTIPNRDTLLPNKHIFWWNQQDYFYSRCVFSNEVKYFMYKYGYSNFNQCRTLFWEDYTGSSIIL